MGKTRKQRGGGYTTPVQYFGVEPSYGSSTVQPFSSSPLYGCASELQRGGRRQRGGSYTGTERYYGVNSSFGTGAPLSSAATASYIRPPMTMQGGKRRNKRKQRGGAMGTERYYGVNSSFGSGAPLSSAATASYIRPPMNMQGGTRKYRGGAFIETLGMGPFAQSAASYLAPVAALSAYKTYFGPKRSSRSTRKKHA